MPTQEWSDEIFLIELDEDPAFTDDVDALNSRLNTDARHVVADLARVRHVGSSNLSQLLKLRKRLIAADRKLILCGAGEAVMSVMLTTGLDNVFDFTDDRATALASVQMG